MTAWRIMHLNDKDYEVRHKPGYKMTVPDTLSRYPMIGPRTMTRIGIRNAVDLLLSALPEAAKQIRKLWVWASQDTVEIARMVQDFKLGREKIYTRAPKESLANAAWEMAILAPRTNKATKVAREVLLSGRPACILIGTRAL